MVTESQKWFLLCSAALLAGLIYLLAPVLTPFILAALLAYMGDPLVDKLEERRIPRIWAVVIVFSLIFFMILLLAVLIVPMLQKQITWLFSQLPAYVDLVRTDIWPSVGSMLGLEANTIDFNEIKSILASQWQSIGGLANDLWGSISQSGLTVMAFLANLVLVPVVTFYLLLDWDRMVAAIHQLFPRRIQDRVGMLAHEIDDVLANFLRGQLTVMFALGFVYSVGLWIVGVELAWLIGFLAGVLSFVPYLGFIVGIGAALIAAFAQFHAFMPLLAVVVVFSIGQLLESFFLTPRLLGDRIGLHPVLVIFAILAGGQLFGFFGVLMALPVAAVVMVLLRHAHDSYTRSRLY